MTRARNLAGLGTVTAQPTTTTPVHLGPLGVGTFARIYGTWEHDQINSVSIGTTQLQISGITTGLNVSGIITAQNGLNITGNITNGLNVSAGIATLQALTATTATFSGDAVFQGNVNIAGTATYEDITDIDSVGVITARKGIIASGISTFNNGLDVSGNIVNGLNVSAGIVTVNDYIQHSGDTNTAIRFPSADTFSVETAGQQNVQVTGTRTLLKSPSGTDTTVRVQHQGNSGYGDIILDRAVNGFIISNDPNNASNNQSYFSVKNKGVENLKITAAGKVGIGTNTFDGIVEVYSPTSKINTLTLRTGGLGGGYAGLAFGSTNNSGREKAALYFQETSGGAHYAGDLVFAVDSNGGDAGQVVTGDEKVRITSAGNFLVNKSSVYGSGKAQIFNTAQYVLDLSTWSADANGPTIDFYKSRNATIGGATIVQSGDVVGRLRFLGNDGANARTAAQITVESDGTPGTNDMPGRIVLATTADGASSSTERMRISQDGQVWIGGASGVTGAFTNTAWNLSVNNGSGDSNVLISGTSGAALELRDTVTSESVVLAANGDCNLYSYKAGDKIRFHNTPSGGSISERMRIQSTGRVAIGNATNNANDTAFLKVYADDGECADLYVGQFANLEATADQSYGVDIRAGSSNVDHGLRVRNRANTTTQLLVRGDGKVGINTDIPNFSQSTPMTTNTDMKVGVEGSITLASMSTSSTHRPQLQFYRRAGYATGSSISSHTMGDIAWYGSSNDSDNSNMAWSLGCTGTGGSWTSGANRTASMIGTNHDGEMWRFSQYGVFIGRAVVNYEISAGQGDNRWTNTGAWKVVVDLAGWPTQTLYMCDASMQYSNAYLATFWVYKTRQSAYQVIVDKDSLLHWRINGSQLELQQNSGVDQTDTSGYQKIFQVCGMK